MSARQRKAKAEKPTEGESSKSGPFQGRYNPKYGFVKKIVLLKTKLLNL